MISAVILKNFKCLDDVNLALGKVTVLCGLNGMGKSSVIQSLLLLQQSYLSTAAKRVDNLVLNGDLINVGTARDALWEGAEKEEDESRERICLGVRVQEEDFIWSFEYDENNDELAAAAGNPTKLPANVGLFSDNLHYLRAERTGPRASFPISTTAVQEKRHLGKDGEFTPFFLSEFGSEKIANESLRHPEAKSIQLRHQVEAWLCEISPGTRIYTESHTKLDIVGLEFAFASATGETNHYRATNVGFGITYTLPIIVAALAATPGSLLLIENPEAHLHPRGQLKMGRLLALASLAGVQIVVETHSDHFFNGLRLAIHAGDMPHDSLAIHFFEREESGAFLRARINSPKVDRAGRLDVWPDGFFDESERALRKLLQPPQLPRKDDA